MYSKEELEDLLNSDVIFDTFMENVEQVRNMKNLQDEMRMGNENLASKYNNLKYLYSFNLFNKPLFLSFYKRKNIISRRRINQIT